jgi:hypothetical protein
LRVYHPSSKQQSLRSDAARAQASASSTKAIREADEGEKIETIATSGPQH